MQPAGGSKRVTITDVGRSAGVSTSAVSKVLNNAYGVSPAMRERVQRAMAELGYRPHAAARGMRGRTYTLGVLLASIRNAFYADLLDGVNTALRGTEYALFLGSSGSSEMEEQTRLIHAMVDRQMDGLILIAPAVARTEVVRIAAEVPTVVIGHHDPPPRTTAWSTRTEPASTWSSTTWSPWDTGTSPTYRTPRYAAASGNNAPNTTSAPPTAPR